ncbi:MAG: hypothetical protein ACK4JY_00520 [Brevundimonas sp.]|uniref:hypothetical protein n=1 Tax=Brevundimonas sp. TaxID=1871086 RepID=UPI00391CA1FA
MRLTMTGAALVLAISTAAATASARDTPLTGRDVIGSWFLRFPPSERQGVTVIGRPEMPLVVAARGAALACTLDDEAANCAIRDGALVVTWTQSGAAMTFTMSRRTREGFSGNTRIRARMLPFSADAGPVDMVRAPAP